eukprot:TRINITY_DN68771_c0_g1_i1.p1 TRINITY_DN68771_c0_g1~~TRINITY_DN68771_c0_g1_i1.p1  ORF type:complete len:373 (+),score=63.96 TRINITY_DN68771_c0_g1_i1:55-1173(+)
MCVSTEDSPDDVAIAVQTAAQWLLEAESMLVGSGAGMGVDAGLGTFRGEHAGVWEPLERHGIDYAEVCQTRWFDEDPSFAWAFWAHCERLYARTHVHAGYGIVSQWASRYKGRGGAFSLTTNIDGHWRKAGWPERSLLERHGRCGLLQCSKNCSDEVWSPGNEQELPPLAIDCDDRVDESRMPLCEECGTVARPNVLMFGDALFAVKEQKLQTLRYKDWLNGIRSKNKFRRKLARGRGAKGAAQGVVSSLSGLVCVEIGCGTTVPTVRRELERLCSLEGARLIRVNPENSSVPQALADNGQAVTIPMNALGALLAISNAVSRLEASATAPSLRFVPLKRLEVTADSHQKDDELWHQKNVPLESELNAAAAAA